jgi:hypothetical protein
VIESGSKDQGEGEAGHLTNRSYSEREASSDAGSR